MTPNPKPIKWTSVKYQKFVREKPCVFCWVPNKSQFHHLRQFCFTGIGTKPSDTYGVPVCPDCHDKDQLKPCKDTWLIQKCVEFITEFLTQK